MRCGCRQLKLFLLCSCLPQNDPHLYLGQTRIRAGNDLAGFVWPFVPFSRGCICKDRVADLESNTEATFHLAGSSGRDASRLGTLVLGFSLPIPAVVR